MKKYTCWHFSRNDNTLGYNDGREIVLGETLSVEGKPKLCDYGLHGSESIIDALGYAAGSNLWMVEIWGSVDEGNDKLCGKNRTALREYGDVLPLIVEFAKWCADRAAESAESAEYAAKYAAEYAEYAAKYAAKSAEYAAKSAKYAAKSAEYAEYAEYAAKYAAEYAAKYAAEYAKSAAKYAAEKERLAQENWWTEKLAQL